MIRSTPFSIVSKCSPILVAWFCCGLFASDCWAEEPEVKPLKLPPFDTIAKEQPENFDTGNPAYRPANELVQKSRAFLNIVNIDESLLRQAFQGIEFVEQDLELLLEMLFRMPQFDIEKIEALVQPLPAWEKLNDETPRYLGGVYRLKGIVKKFQDLTPPEYTDSPPKLDETLDGSLKRLASRKTIQHIYRTDILVGGKILQVYSNRVPHAWLKKKAPGEKLLAWQGGQEVEVWGYLLKQGAPDADPAYYFAAPRVRWYPNTFLGKLGFDYELFDDVRQKQTLLKGENEVFYEFLATAKRTPAEIYDLAKPQEHDIVELWKSPEQQVGDLMSFRGQVHHVARIAVEDPALAKRLGFDYYYNMQMFVPLKVPTIVKIPVQPKDDEGNKEDADNAPQEFDKIHFDSMPLVFYFHEMPAGETVQTLENKQVIVRGFFLKSWRYQSNVPSANKKHALLLGPLLMGNNLELEASSPLPGVNVPGVLILGMIAASVFAGIVYLWLNRRDHRKRSLAMPEKIEFDRGELES